MSRTATKKIDDDEPKAVRMTDGRVHLAFIIKLYETQRVAWRYLLHEHPFGVASWREPGVILLAGMDEVFEAKAHMCRYGVTRECENCVKHVNAAIGFLRNSFLIANEFDPQCDNSRDHVAVEGADRT